MHVLNPINGLESLVQLWITPIPWNMLIGGITGNQLGAYVVIVNKDPKDIGILDQADHKVVDFKAPDQVDPIIEKIKSHIFAIAPSAPTTPTATTITTTPNTTSPPITSPTATTFQSNINELDDNICQLKRKGKGLNY